MEITSHTLIKDLLTEGMISVRANNVCASNGIMTINDLMGCSHHVLATFDNCGKKTLDELRGLKERVGGVPMMKIPDPENVILYNKLDETSKRYLDERFDAMFITLSTRTRNVFSHVRGMSDMLEYCYGQRGINMRHTRLCGRKSASEFETFINESRRLVDDYLKKVAMLDENGRNELRRSHRMDMTRDRFPFLNEEEIERVSSRGDNGLTPVFLMIRFIMRTETNQTLAFRSYYGLDKGCERKTLDEIGRELGLSRERVRQLICSPVSFPPEVLRIASRLAIRLGNTDLVAYDSPLWEEIEKNEAEPSGLNVFQLMALITALDSDYAITTLSRNYDYLIRKESFKGIRLLSTIRDMEQRIDNRRMQEEPLDLMPYIAKGRMDNSSAKASSVAALMRHYLHTKYKCRPSGDFRVMMPASTFNIMTAIEEIIEENKGPIAFTDLFTRFAERYPGNVPRSELSFKSYIFRDKNIRSIGKSGRYVLASWGKMHTGTITDMLANILSSANNPMTLYELYEAVSEIFPNTKPSSCANLMFLDSKHRFVQYKGNRYGLSSREYRPQWEKHVPRSHAYDFDERLGEVEQFVQDNKRMPYSGGGPRERQLARWIKCVANGRIHTDETQRKKISEFMARHADIPQNGDELRYHKNCLKVKELYDRTGHMPTYRDGAALNKWFREQMTAKEEAASENIRRYREELRAFVKRIGLRFP